MPARRALLVVNAKSRTGAEARETVIAALDRHGIGTIEPECSSREDVARCIVDLAPQVELVVVAGGDGTMNAAAPGLAESGLPLGVMPTGTANDLARTLGIPSDLDQAAAIIAAGRSRQIDLGLVNGHPFFNVASIGLAADLSRELTSDIKRRFGRVGYALAALRVLTRARPFRATIATPSSTRRVLTLQITVGNGRFYGGGNVVEEDARIDDQRLDLYSLEFRRAWMLALLARSFRFGEHGAWRAVRTISGSEFSVTTRRPKAVNVDGEIVTQTPAQFAIQPKAVTVFVPPDPAPG